MQRLRSGNCCLPPLRTPFVPVPIVMHCSNSITVIEGVWAARATTLNWPFGLDCPEPSQGGPPQQMAPLLLLDHVHNVTIRGGGTLDGNGEMWWRHACGNWWCPPENAHAGAETETTKTPPKKAFRPFLLRIEHSHDVTVENITFFNPGFWNLVPVRSQHILIQDVNVTARWPEGSKKPAPADPYAATPNTDGFEPMWSNHVTFRRCRVLNGDDCITIKSGSSNILVEDLYCEHGDGLTIGSDLVRRRHQRDISPRCDEQNAQWADDQGQIARQCNSGRTSHSKILSSSTCV